MTLHCLGAAPTWLRVQLSGGGDQAELLAAVPAEWVHPARPAGCVLASDGQPVGPSVALFAPSLMTADVQSGQRDDAYFVAFCVLALTAARGLAFRLVFHPVAAYVNIGGGPMERHKFCESSWQCLWYSLAFCWGCRVQYSSSFWFGPLGGRADWRESLWADYPQALHTFDMKVYYLVQLSFWLHMIVVTLVEVHRSDFAMMMIHHVITSWLVGTSYMMNYVRIGLAIMVCFDFADIFLPLAKALRYLRVEPLDDIAFVTFAVAVRPQAIPSTTSP